MTNSRWMLGIFSAALSIAFVAFADEQLEDGNRIERIVREAVDNDSKVSGERLTVADIAETYGDKAARAWKALLTDERPEIRSKARSGLREVGTRSANTLLRQEALEKIVSSSFADGIVDANVQYLYGFRPSDANSHTRELILNRLRESVESGNGLRYECGVLLAAGTLNLEEAIPELRAIRKFEKSRKGKRPIIDSCAMLALARMGDAVAIRDSIEEHRSIENLEKRTLLLGNLAYIRKQEIVQYLTEYLLSDVVYPGASKDSGPVSDQWYAYLALQAMIVIPDDIDYAEFPAWVTAQTKYEFKED
jgi:hypothetical protein